METKEIFERVNITDGQKRIGCVSVRFPVFNRKRIDNFYTKQADVFIKYAEKKKLCGTLNCRVTYEDEESVSVITDSRLYKNNECVHRHKSSLVWDRKRQHLRYIRKWGIRHSNITYNGSELSIFN